MWRRCWYDDVDGADDNAGNDGDNKDDVDDDNAGDNDDGNDDDINDDCDGDNSGNADDNNGDGDDDNDNSDDVDEHNIIQAIKRYFKTYFFTIALKSYLQYFFYFYFLMRENETCASCLGKRLFKAI